MNRSETKKMHHREKRTSKRRKAEPRRGSILVLSTIFMIVMLGFIALALDTGYVASVKTDLKRATDAGALAGAGALVNGSDVASAEVLEFIQANAVGGRTISADDVDITFGHWDDQTASFAASNELPSAVRVEVALDDAPLFFARVLGRDSFDLTDESIAMYQPRDILLVLDYSGSMNDDSELKSEWRMGVTEIDTNLQQIYTELGSPTFGSMQWDQTLSSSWSNSYIRSYLGLNSVPYPYPVGSWYEYVDYVKGSVPYDYRHHYGYKTWINYLLHWRESSTETPALWQTSEQPITALKNSVSVFLAYLQEVDTDDRLGLSVYTASDGTSYLEHELTRDFDAVETTSRERQAGHYHSMTNIGAGILTAREEIQEHGRTGAFKMIVLMTDGIANRPYSSSYARQYALDQAQDCADAGIPVVTISLGAGADTGLMNSIANMTGGVHFNIPGGQSVEDYEEDLKDAFREIADDRPLKLVK
ncbi:MAG: VWA domain-containing protein [Pirellulales bacterium]|nr:VWA domain-containing protein [Pirellulales bacterium]